jgi:hypothetical protein
MDPGQMSIIRLEVPDASFRLSQAERQRIRTGFDVDALERLVANVRPELRHHILESFTIQPADFLTTNSLIKIGDPFLQALLDEVWAPVWEQFPPDALDTETVDYPGRELASQRRRSREVADPQ